jgi:hypothetical protein
MAKKNGKMPPTEDPTSIGNVLIAMGFIAKDDLDALVRDFVSTKDEMLGEFLVKKQAVSKDDVETALIRQKVLRREFSHESMREVLVINQNRNDRISTSIESVLTASRLVLGKVHGK